MIPNKVSTQNTFIQGSLQAHKLPDTVISEVIAQVLILREIT